MNEETLTVWWWPLWLDDQVVAGGEIPVPYERRAEATDALGFARGLIEKVVWVKVFGSDEYDLSFRWPALSEEEK